MAQDGSVVFGTELDTTGLKSGLAGTEKMSALVLSKIGKTFSFAAISTAIVKLGKIGIEYNAQMESYATNFGVMLGDEAAALEHVASLREMAAKTPFGMKDLADASQTMLSFGLDAEYSMEAMRQLGDISLGNAERFGSLSLAFSQVSASGKLMGQDLMQMINAGFNPLATIAEKTGVSIGDLKDVMSGGKGSKDYQKAVKAARQEVKKLGDQASEGAKMLAQIGEEGMISAEMVGWAMQLETGPGGRFYQGMQKASETLAGTWSTLQDETTALIGNVFQPIANVLSGAILPAATSVVSALNELFEGSDVQIEISAEVEAAKTSLASLKFDLDGIFTNYQQLTITADINKEKADALVDELEALQATPKELWTDEDVARMQAITSALTSIYPELQKYVGSDGVINAEKENVQGLIDNYYALAKAKAFASLSDSYLVELADAETQVELLARQKEGLEEQKKAAQDAADAYGNVAEAAQNGIIAYADAFSFGSFTGMSADNVEALQAGADALREYVAIGGDLSNINVEDLQLLMGADGSVLEIDPANVEQLMALGNALQVISEFSTQKQQESQALANAYDAEILAQAELIDQATAELEAAAQRYAIAQESLNALINGAKLNGETDANTGEVKKAPGEGIGEQIVKNAATGIETTGAEVSTAVDKVVGDAEGADVSGFNSVGTNISLGMAQGIRNGQGAVVAAVNQIVYAALAAAKSSARIKSPSRLFRDEVGAMLAAGTAVGVESNAHLLETAVAKMVNASIPDMRGVGTQIMNRSASYTRSDAMMAALAGGSFNQTNNFNVPVQTPDEFADTMHIYATYGLQG